VLDSPHQPAGDDDRTDEEHKAVGSEAHHHLGFRALRDAEDDRGEESEQENSAEVCEHLFYDAFLPLASECASTAAMIFSSPPTTRNFVP